MLGRETSRRLHVELKLVYERIRCMPLMRMGDEGNEVWRSVFEAVDGRRPTLMGYARIAGCPQLFISTVAFRQSKVQ